jgi:hypothetical protein
VKEKNSEEISLYKAAKNIEIDMENEQGENIVRGLQL